MNIKAANKKDVKNSKNISKDDNVSKKNNVDVISKNKFDKKENIKKTNSTDNNELNNNKIKDKNNISKDIKDENLKSNDNVLKNFERINDTSNDKDNNKKIDDLLFFDDDEEFNELFGDEAMFLENNKIPFFFFLISFSYYLTLINYNLKSIPKDQRNNYFSKNIANFNSSVIILYKFTNLHKSLWNKFLVKKPNNKALIYIRDHFVPKIGIFFEKGDYRNYYSYKVKNKNDDNSKYKDTESNIGISILRLGLALQNTWLYDEPGMINCSIMISSGWQTNYHKQGCFCLHCKDENWLDISSNFYDVNAVGANYYVKKINDFKLNQWYFMVHLEFGFYFIKIFTRFYSPISKSNSTNMSFLDFFKMDNYDIKDQKNNDMSQNVFKKLNFDKWTMSWGISLSL